jgi:hypothetical protein
MPGALLARRFAVAVIFILLITAVSVPMVNKRSQRLEPAEGLQFGLDAFRKWL